MLFSEEKDVGFECGSTMCFLLMFIILPPILQTHAAPVDRRRNGMEREREEKKKAALPQSRRVLAASQDSGMDTPALVESTTGSLITSAQGFVVLMFSPK